MHLGPHQKHSKSSSSNRSESSLFNTSDCCSDSVMTDKIFALQLPCSMQVVEIVINI